MYIDKIRACKFIHLILCCILTNFLFTSTAESASSQVSLDRERDRVQEGPLSQPKIRIDEERQQRSPVNDGVMLTLHSLSISGNTVFTAEELLSPYQNLYGQRIPYSRLREISDELTRKYREAGYILSRVVMPAQETDIASANIRFVAIEGYLQSVTYSGDSRILERFKSYFAPAEKRLLAMKPLDHSVFERYVLLMRDAPGIEISSRFERGSVPGGSILHINVKGDMVDGSLSWGNMGTKETGPWIGSVGLGVNALPFIGNRTSVTYTQAADRQEYWSVQVAERYQMWNGLTFTASWAYSDSPEMDSEFAELFDYQTESNTFNIGSFYPIIRSRDLNLRAGINYEHRNSDTFIADEHTGKDRLRTLSANLNFDFSDSWGGITQIIPTIYRGLKVFDASDKSFYATNTLAPAEYWKFGIYASRDQQLPYNFSLFTAAEAQFANESLSSYNRFSFGGSHFGRGYDLGAIEGDNGFAVSFEPRWTQYPTDTTAFQLFSFIDYGTVWTTKSTWGMPDQQEGSSVGLGCRLWGRVGSEMMPDFNITAFVAQPMQAVEGYDADTPRLVIQGGIFF